MNSFGHILTSLDLSFDEMGFQNVRENAENSLEHTE